MSKLLNEVAFNKQIQRIVETKKGLILNGSYYQKSSMTPLPFAFFPAYGGCTDVAMSKRALLGTGAGLRIKNRGNLIATDIDDPEIQYLFLFSTRSENTQNIMKIKETDDSCVCLNNVIVSGSPRSNSIVYQIVGQDTNYLYVLFESNGLWGTFSKINKNTLTIENIKAYGQYIYVQGLYETDEYIYLVTSSKGKNTINRYTKSDNTLIEYNSILNEETVNDMACEFTDPIKIDNHLIVYGLKLNTVDIIKQLQVVKIDIDLQNSDLNTAITESIVNTTYTEEIDSLPILSNLYIHYEPFITSISGSTYLNIAIYDVYNSTAANYPKFGIYTFKFNEDNLELKSFLNFGNVAFRGFLSLNDNKDIIALTEQSLFFTNFTLASESYIINDNKIVNAKAVGIDLEDNVWFITGSNSVELVNTTSADSVEISAEQESYKYNGENISTFINVSAKNINGELIETKLSLVIKGEATWDSNNTKNINITTSSTEVLKIPITIKNNGNLSIIPRFIL